MKTTTEPLTYEEVCNAYFEWCKQQPGNPQQPNESLSVEHYGVWQLESINGPLVAVTADKEVIPVCDFYEAYVRLSFEGKCDGAGGMEYRRVLTEWIEDQPEDLDEFIHRRANIGPWDIDVRKARVANDVHATKRVKVRLSGQEVVAVSTEVVVEVPQDTTTIELASVDVETISELAGLEWQLGDVKDRNIDRIVGMKLTDESEADVKLVLSNEGKLIPAEQ